ncbi:hypothetical protein FIBSPDRAFT_551884 [Athelia psychrophila]|uniref:Uncharacterized protein n=1 Tax=Athelia psychrophila TaxID=1759441 RepID=A0A166UVE3_9AGAM|nr:hypothetical protein FIBSPDRAFT_551884 [Fibularhizoctonia sp. CBS 109695]
MNFFKARGGKFQKDDPAGKKPRSLPPWKLDPAFFMAMSRWTEKHPGSTLKSVMDKICSVIESSDDVMQFIPDSPFPARTLVTALVSLLKLGIKISEAKSAVFEFAKQVADWLDQIQPTTARENNKGPFSRATFENLVPCRDLINEICTWATHRLVRSRATTSPEVTDAF